MEIGDLIGIARVKLRRSIEILFNFYADCLQTMFYLWGDRGTGKSSLIKGMLGQYESDGLRLVEVNRDGLLHLQEIADLLWSRPERYILFCDDLAFSEGEPEYRELKAMLEGGISARPENVLIYATSNRRHLMPRQVQENQFPSTDEDELYPRETTEEKVSLSDRFGLRLAFYQDSPIRIFADGLTLCPGNMAYRFRQRSYIVRRWSGRRHPAGVRAVLPASSLTT